MDERPFHHGRLREELLERAERVVREDGPDGLSMRDLARQAGVSHAAPRRHFVDRRALLDAVAERTFDRLTTTLSATFEATHGDSRTRFRAAAEAYVSFAANEAKLHDLMFRLQGDRPPDALRAAADRFFTVTTKLLVPAGADENAPFDDPRRLLVVVSLQGLAALVVAGRLPPTAVGPLLDEATRVFTRP